MTPVKSTCAIAAVTSMVSLSAFADEYSKRFAQVYSMAFDAWMITQDTAKRIECSNSRVVTMSYRVAHDMRVVQHGEYGYMVTWSEIESGVNISTEHETPQEVVSTVSVGFARDFKDWSELKSYNAGITRHYEAATATNKDNRLCLVVTGKRATSSRITLVTCADTLPTDDEIKTVLKTFR